MKIGERYIVTKESNDGTFRKGDHIKLCDNGDVICWEAEGWITADEVTEAISGMEYKIDSEWAERRKKELLAELARLNEITPHKP
mgnify:CR=1 FL=1